MIKKNPDSIRLGGIDHELEERLARKRKREEVFQKRQEKEHQRVEQASRQEGGDDDAVGGDDDDDGGDDGDDGGDDNDDDYRPGSFGHERTRPKRLRLEFDVDDLRDSFSRISDRREMTSRDRSDVLSNFVEKGGEDLNHLPCSPMTMIK